jgi:amino acid adenylation domain-containing protein
MNTSESPRSARFVTVLEQIREVVERQPSSIAIVSKEEQVTYAKLLARAESTAIRFREAEVLGQGIVAVCTTDTIEMTVCALASWICGFAYLPIDPTWPLSRAEHILNEAKVSIVATQSVGLWHAPTGAWRQMLIEDPRELHGDAPKANRRNIAEVIDPDQVAYIIYTSGSTGKPKGVAVAHRSLSNFADWYRYTFQLNCRDRISQLAALTFDVSVGEIFPTLTAGARLCVGDRRIYASPEDLYQFLVSEEVTVSQVATVAVAALLKLPWGPQTKLRSLQTGGDVLRVAPPDELLFELVNLYGPTECTILATAGVVSPGKLTETLPSIGRPIWNTHIYILDENLQEVSKGQEGEICIAGSCVALGYVNRPDLTTEKFVTRRLIAHEERLYRTGDLGRERPNGEFECLGRIDDQIKLLGLRIEPNEILIALKMHRDVADAAISTVGMGEQKRLVAYVKLNRTCTVETMRAHLGERIPAYMVPAIFVSVDSIPLNTNGKVNLKGLPPPDSSNMLPSAGPVNDREPNPLERKIIGLWQAVFDIPSIRLDDDFFAIGGTSLRAARLFSRIESEFGKHIPVSAILQISTVRKIAALVDDQSSVRFIDCVIPLNENTGDKPLFLVHPISGNILSYRDLAARLTDLPVYGIQARHSDATSIERIAAEYLGQLRKIQEKGPYRFAGYSAGGIIAFEMTRQLLDAGENVSSLFLIDSHVGPTMGQLTRQGRLSESSLLFYSFLKRDIRNITQNGLLSYIHARIRKAALRRNLVRAYYRFACLCGVSSDSVSALTVEAALLRAVKSYSPPTLPVEAVLFRSYESLRDHIDPTLGWKRVIAGKLEIYDFVGGHHTILSTNTVRQLAAILQEKLNIGSENPEPAPLAFAENASCCRPVSLNCQ